MHRALRAAAVALVVPALAFVQGVLREQLLSSDQSISGRAIETVTRLEPNQVDDATRNALIAVLQRERARALHRTSSTEDDMLGPVVRAIVRLHDPRFVPELAATLLIGPIVPKELAHHGDAAAVAVLATLRKHDVMLTERNDGLIALRMIVELTPPTRLSTGTRQQIQVLAGQYLARDAGLDEMGVLLTRAIDLAVVLGDPGLREIVRRIANDPAESAARGTVPSRIPFVQKRAADRLAGALPLPRPE
jgi:hypothetical protein